MRVYSLCLNSVQHAKLYFLCLRFTLDNSFPIVIQHLHETDKCTKNNYHRTSCCQANGLHNDYFFRGDFEFLQFLRQFEGDVNVLGFPHRLHLLTGKRAPVWHHCHIFLWAVAWVGAKEPDLYSGICKTRETIQPEQHSTGSWKRSNSVRQSSSLQFSRGSVRNSYVKIPKHFPDIKTLFCFVVFLGSLSAGFDNVFVLLKNLKPGWLLAF